MLDNSKGKMFLAGERGYMETEWFRSYNTFNFGNYQQEHKDPFGPLYVLNDNTLAGKKGFKLLVEEDSDIMLLPVAGALEYKDSLGNETIIKAGEAQLFSTSEGTTIEISNPFENDLINFLQLWIKKPLNAASVLQVSSFDIEMNKNSLIDLFPSPPLSLKDSCPHTKFSIGKFVGREEFVYKLSHLSNKLFVFVLEGAFEVQYRLMEARDGLALWNMDAIEVEALSNDAIILLMETYSQHERI
jgi:redox-sensitive bicupin YhaK (pirin superfamily)